MVDTKVMIGYATQEYGRRSDFYDYVNLLEKPADSMILPCHERSPAKARNVIAEQAIQYNCTHILWLDDDMAFRPNSLRQLLEHDKDVVSGLYFSRAYPHQPLAFDLADENGACVPMYMDEDTPRLVEIVAAGLGFLLIKTEVLKKLEKPWIRLGELDPEEWCDDIGFFNRLRKAGIQSYCDTDCRIGHIGSMIIWPNKVNGAWFSGYDSQGIGFMGDYDRQMVNVPQFVLDKKYEFKE